jgi:hypothetical protein
MAARRWQTMRTFALSLLVLVGLGVRAPVAAVSVATESGVQVTVESNGHFEVRTSTPAWTFGGDVGRPLANLSVGDGRDGIGAYREVAFESAAATEPAGSIRAYAAASIVLFTTEYRSTTSAPDAFPTLRSYPALPYRLSYRTLPFAPYQFNSLDNAADSPWFFFDPNGNAFVLAAASNFPIARTTRNADASLSSSIAPVDAIPGGLSHATMLVTDVGINRVFTTWGEALLHRYQKVRPDNDADVTLDRIGYWTDNGAAYYYNFEPALGYAGTLHAIAREFDTLGIRLGYMQLDSWWYPKGPDARWDGGGRGIFRYRAAAELLPDGLADFQQQIGLPLVTHGRWIDPDSPLRAEYESSGNVITDQAYWDDVMAYLHDGGVVTYEQDWLGEHAQPMYDLAAPGQFLGNMAAAAARYQMTLQYCMPLPRHVLQTLLYPNVTTMRVSYDRFDSTHWDEFLYDSRLASALGVWPFTDVFMSTERSNLLLATLSAGIVGVGDPLGGVDVANLRRVIRADGTIVKPDVPIVPTDATFLAEARGGPRSPMVASTFSDHGALRAAYVFAYARDGSGQQVSLTPSSLGVFGPAYVYDVFADRGRLARVGDTFTTTVDRDGGYFIVVPLGPSGIAFLGDQGLFAALGRKRISHLADDGAVHAMVEFAVGESQVTLHGYAPAAPVASTLDGALDEVEFDTLSHRFSVGVRAATTPGSVTVTLRLPRTWSPYRVA